jgi:pimeloyl-ACP methyl ester carboxylesterase
MNPGRQSEIDKVKKLSGYAVPIARFGLARLAVTSLLCRSGRISGHLAGAGGAAGRHVLMRITQEVGKMPKRVWPIVAAHWSRPGYYAGMRSHVEAVPDTVREMQDAEPIHDRIGDNVQQVIAPTSAHWIHLDQPDLVIDSIREMVVAATAVEPVAATV